jgi:cytochrome oxidase Cu insertion factor (SCO1/SenC/PrrC family)
MRNAIALLTASFVVAACGGGAPAGTPAAAGPAAPAATPGPAASVSARPRVGDTAPALDLRDQDDVPWTLASLRGTKWVVVAFYPKAATPG